MTSLTDALIDVEAALQRLAVALVTGQPDSVLAAEESLAASVRQILSAPREVSDPLQVARQIAEVRVALMTCQRLGRASAGYVQAVTPATPYSAKGHVTPSRVPSTVEART